MNDPNAHPLSWPHGRTRTPAHERKPSNFGRERQFAPTIAIGLVQLRLELGRMNVRDFIVSTNVELRRDGLPYSGRRDPEDPGVAVYFNLDGRPTVLACDKWDKVADNMRAIVKHIDALRGQDRWGVGTLAQAFAGFVALPPPSSDEEAKRPWREVLRFGEREHVMAGDIRKRWRKLVAEAGLDEDRQKELNIAKDEALEEVLP